jgi:OOP family OmpA-OmpF porin
VSADRLEELRNLILKPDKARLESLGARIESPEHRAADVAEVLPESISASFAQGSRLIGALSRPIKQCISDSVREEPDEYAAALFPVMGPAIRRSILETLRAWTQQFNRVIELSLSPLGVRWRFEAWRAGVPFGQYVIQKTLVYCVEDIYLIHSSSGLLVGHVSQASVPHKDEDAVSAMFTAIQSFVSDSFSYGNKERLTTADLGDLTLWAVHGPHSTIVAVIRGVAPIEIRLRLESALERIEREKGQQLAAYRGDRESMRDVEPILTSCLLTAMRDDRSARRPLAAYAVASAVLIALVGWMLRGVWLDSAAETATRALAANPGIVVTGFERHGRTLTIRGLRDRLAGEPAAIVAAAGWNGDILADFRPFLSLDDTLVTARALSSLRPPEGVELDVTDGALVLSGAAPPEWIETARSSAQLIPGVDRVDDSRLVPGEAGLLADLMERLDPPPTVELVIAGSEARASGTASRSWLDTAITRELPAPLVTLDLGAVTVLELEEMGELAARIGALTIRFEPGVETPTSMSLAAVEEATAIMLAYARLAERVGATPALTVTGYSDATGAEAFNRALEIRRAGAVAAALIEGGVPADWLSVRGHLESGVAGFREPLVSMALVPQYDASGAPRD